MRNMYLSAQTMLIDVPSIICSLSHKEQMTRFATNGEKDLAHDYNFVPWKIMLFDCFSENNFRQSIRVRLER